MEQRPGRALAIAGILLAFVLGVLATCPRDSDRNRICAGHGVCNVQNLCECDSRHTGFDCSRLLCPKGPAWVAPARATDDAHFEVECSNKGACDRANGVCVCEKGFTGTACQRLACPENCNDAGDCLSLRQLSSTLAVGSEPIYSTIWDADMIYGCRCRKGFQGYDCSKRSCPRGDDPLTTGQVNEVQVLRCRGTAGYFYLYFEGIGVTVPFDATFDAFNTILRSLSTLPPVRITFSVPSSPVCSTTVTNVITIEFTQTFGPQSPIKVLNNLKGVVTLIGGAVNVATGGAVLEGKASIVGTKEWDVCSNRGHCDEATGQCACFLMPMPGYRSSDGYGNPGIRGDCGCANDKNLYGGSIKACVGELACSGHGYCTGSPSYRCQCVAGWTEGDCAMRACPSGPSWFRAPSSLNIVHNQRSVCSDAGICDRTNGQCQCYSPFDGTACEFMKCPGEPVCNGHGRCVPIRQLSLEADVDSPSLRFDYGADPNNEKTFDRNSIMGCQCDPGFQGYDCNQQSCPVGDDPATSGQVDEIQLIQCIASGGTFKLAFRTSVSSDIPFDASPATMRIILMASFFLEDLLVEYSIGSQACSPSSATTKNVIRITFVLTFGNVPPLLVSTSSLSGTSPSIRTAENGDTINGIVSQTGTKERIECSNRGYCNYETGVCVCASGYASSDGRGNIGNRGDCGYRLPTVRISS